VRAVPVLKLRETGHLSVHYRRVDPPVALARLSARLARLLEGRTTDAAAVSRARERNADPKHSERESRG
jgi:hypothetical protein